MKVIIEIQPRDFIDMKLSNHHETTLENLWNEELGDYEPSYRTEEFQKMLHDEINSWLDELDVDIKKISFE